MRKINAFSFLEISVHLKDFVLFFGQKIKHVNKDCQNIKEGRRGLQKCRIAVRLKGNIQEDTLNTIIPVMPKQYLPN